MIDQKKFLKDVNYENYFWLRDGSIIKNLNELRDAIKHMHEETFNYHINKQDFSKWIRNIIGYKILADELENIKDQNKAYKIVETRINNLNGIKTTIQQESDETNEWIAKIEKFLDS